MTLRESLQAISPIPLPQDFISACGEEFGIDVDRAEIGDVEPRELARIKARIFFRLATTPNISEGGVSISFNAEDKKIFLALARQNAVLGGVPGLVPGVTYGYKGENL